MNYQGFSADLAAAVCLLLSSADRHPGFHDPHQDHGHHGRGRGAGAFPARQLGRGASEMVLTWVLTFPGCGLIGFLMAKLFIAIF